MLGGNLKNSKMKSIVRYVCAWKLAGEDLAIAPRLMTPPATDSADCITLRLTWFVGGNGGRKIGQGLYVRSCSRYHGSRGHQGKVMFFLSFLIKTFCIFQVGLAWLLFLSRHRPPPDLRSRLSPPAPAP